MTRTALRSTFMDVEDVCRGDPDDTTALPTTAGSVAELAWSETPADNNESRGATWGTVWVRALFLLAAGAVIAVLVVWAAHNDWTLRRQTPVSVSAVPAPSAVTPTARPSAAAPSPPPPATVTSPAQTTAAAPPSPTTDPVRENNFMAALKNAVDLTGPNHISYADIPGSHGAYMGDLTAWLPGGPVVRYGYKACAVLSRYPNDRKRATDVFYGGLGFRGDVDASTERARATYMDVVAVDLCEVGGD